MVITLHYYEGLTMKSIAKILQISASRVSQIHSRILLEMRMVLEDDTEKIYPIQNTNKKHLFTERMIVNIYKFEKIFLD